VDEFATYLDSAVGATFERSQTGCPLGSHPPRSGRAPDFASPDSDHCTGAVLSINVVCHSVAGCPPACPILENLNFH